jgi:hypothetical protein
MRHLAVICSPLLSALLALAQPVSSNGGQAPAGEPAAPALQAGANRVSVRFQFVPKKGSAAADLLAEDIELREDGVPRKIATLRGGPLHLQPVEINVLFDDLRPTSGLSVGPSWMRSKPFDLSAIDDHGRVSLAIWGAGRNVVQLAAPTQDPAALSKALEGLWQLWANTPPTESYLQASGVQTLIQAAARGRIGVDRMLVILASNFYLPAGRNWATEAVRAARSASVAIFPVELRNVADQPPFSMGPAPWPTSVLDAQAAMNRRELGLSPGPGQTDVSGLLAEGTGGRSLRVEYMPPDSPFDKIWKSLGEELKRHDYVVGFDADSSVGEWRSHKVEVILRDPNRGQIAGGKQTAVH